MAPVTVLYYGVLSALAKIFVLYRGQQEARKKEYAGKVEELHFFPLKSARNISVQQVQVISTGFQIGKLGDRGLAIMTPKGHAITAMREPTVTTLITRYSDHTVQVEIPDDENILKIDLNQVEKDGVLLTAKFIGQSADVYDCGEQAADWVSDFLGKPGHRIIYCGVGLKRRQAKDVIVNNAKLMHLEFTADWLDTIPDAMLTWTNSSPITAVSQKSLDDVDERLPRPVGHLRFRTNIIAADVQEAYDEDTWDDIYINDVHLKFCRLVGRCNIVNTDPDTGLREKGDCTVLKSMKEWRAFYKKRASYVYLSIHCTVVKPGTIHVGDKIYVTKRQKTSQAVVKDRDQE